MFLGEQGFPGVPVRVPQFCLNLGEELLQIQLCMLDRFVLIELQPAPHGSKANTEQDLPTNRQCIVR